MTVVLIVTYLAVGLLCAYVATRIAVRRGKDTISEHDLGVLGLIMIWLWPLAILTLVPYVTFALLGKWLLDRRQ